MPALSPGPAVRHMMPNEADTYDSEFETWPRAMIYGSSRFARFVEEVAHCRVAHLLAERSGELVGALPFAVKTDTRYGTVINSLPWFGSHGGCWLRSSDDRDAREALLDAFSSAASALDPLFSVIILSHSENAAAAEYSRLTEHASVSDRIGQVLELPLWQENYEQALFDLMSRRTRNHVRKSLKQGLEEKVGDHDSSWQFLYRTHCDNMDAISGRAKPWDHFSALRRRYAGRGMRLSLACLHGEPIAGLLVIVFGRTVEYLVPAISVEKRTLQPLSFLIWRAMFDCARQGCRIWNWGGTGPSQHSLHHFKAGWGGEDRPYTYLSRVRGSALASFRSSPTDFLDAFPYFYLYPMDGSAQMKLGHVQASAT